MCGVRTVSAFSYFFTPVHPTMCTRSYRVHVGLSKPLLCGSSTATAMRTFGPALRQPPPSTSTCSSTRQSHASQELSLARIESDDITDVNIHSSGSMLVAPTGGQARWVAA